ncbi:putative ABC transport system permease protein [Tamaricihabitans halophyticus]|uniref:Putative ABC transport system permease protein n=1 Tax=Tamaricihabitans halophyticus TaxID=1262583 RepID=A0A4R2PTJ9_9PSEU|nr:FtsX-like permease family protein [Tamaricihabitans halophyticus]TCP39167.1 putative ABC transport system permease protein [Tamaricihabitans halophyticus]
MLVLAGQTLRSRKSAFVGSFVALVLGSAMLTAAVSVITSAGSIQLTGEDKEALDAVSSVIGFMAGLTAFLSVFIVASTFAFAVATRARELALLRMVGATPKQVRRLVRAEALLVGLLGAIVGCLLGLLLGTGLAGLLVLVGVAPDGFELQLSGATMYVALPVAFATGLIVTWFGAGSAARRASKLRPLTALRDVDVDTRVMTGKRWFMGLLFLGIGIAEIVILPSLDGDVQIPIVVFLAEPFVIAAVLLAPVFVGRLYSSFTRDTSATGMLAGANLRTGVRRTAATSAPVLLAVGICGSLLGVSLVMSAATDTSIRELYASDFVISGNVDTAVSAARQAPGVEGVSTIGDARVRTVAADGLWDQPVSATVVDPGTMQSALRLSDIAGSPDQLRGPAVMIGRSLAGSMGWELGGEYSMRLPDGASHQVRVVATYQDNALIQSMLVARDFVPAETTTVHVSAPDDPKQARDAVAKRLPGSQVTGTEDWLEPLIKEQSSGMQSGSWLLSGFALIYTLLAIANTTAMAFRSRRHEFTSLRFLGANAGQLRDMVRHESIALGLGGAVLGGVIAFGTSVAAWAALRTSVPDTPLVLPVLEVLMLTACCVGMMTAVSAVAVRKM